MKKLILFFILFFYFLLPIFKVPIKSAPPDKIAPVSTISVNPTTPNGENSWYTIYPTVSIDSTDNLSGVEYIYYKINSDPWVKNNYTNYLNLIRNSSFENGYIDSWQYSGGFASIGYKSSLYKYSGNYSSGIVSLNFTDQNYWYSEKYISSSPLTTYYYSFYLASITSFLDNGFYEIVSIDSKGTETVLKSVSNIDLKLNYKNFTGSFTTNSSTNSSIVIKLGIVGLGHLTIDDVSISKSPPEDSTEFILNQEGINTVSFYSEDTAGNIENTKVATIKVDTVFPTFQNFRTQDQINTHKFTSLIDTQDITSGLYSNETLFNYSVNGIDNGYYTNYSSCSGDFNNDLFLNINNDFQDGDNDGTLTTPSIDYCDANFLICKELRFYVKDLAGNVASRNICVNGPYVSTKDGNIFARNSISSLGQGMESNLSGIATSSGTISDILSSIDVFISNFTDFTYLNNVYLYYYQRLYSYITSVSDISTSSGIYYIQGGYTINDSLTYSGVSQVVFIDGNLTIKKNIISNNSFIYYLVNGVVTIENDVTQLSAVLSSTNQIYTSSSYDLASKITINGALIASSINFNRNTDKTLGASELINFPLDYFFRESYLKIPVMYRTEILD